MSDPLDEILAVATHEASHAVAALGFGVGVLALGIDKQNASGFCRYNKADFAHEHHWVTARISIITSVAGGLGASRFAGVPYDLNHHQSSDDKIQIARMLQAVEPDDVKARGEFFLQCREAAEEELDTNWHIVTALASRLVEDELLDGDTVNAVARCAQQKRSAELAALLAQPPRN